MSEFEVVFASALGAARRIATAQPKHARISRTAAAPTLPLIIRPPAAG